MSQVRPVAGMRLFDRGLQLQLARCDEPMTVVSHHRNVQKRLVALDVGHPDLVRRIGPETDVAPGPEPQGGCAPRAWCAYPGAG